MLELYEHVDSPAKTTDSAAQDRFPRRVMEGADSWLVLHLQLRTYGLHCVWPFGIVKAEVYCLVLVKMVVNCLIKPLVS